MVNNDREVARQAEKMLEASLRAKTASFRDHVNRAPEDVSLKKATAKAGLKKYGSRRAGNLTHYMRSLSIRMTRHGFIQHHGVDTVRSGGSRTRTKPQTVSYGFKSHTMKMRAQPFINEAVESSRVVDYVMNNLSRIRAESLLVEVRRILEK